MEKKKVINQNAKMNKSCKYTNDKSLAKVSAKRIDNYAEELAKSLEQYAEEIGSAVLAYNKTSSEKTMGVRFLRSSSRKIQNRRSHQDMVEGIAVECSKKLGLNTGIVRIMARNHDVRSYFFWTWWRMVFV